MATPLPRRFPALRALSNVVVLLALLLGADYVWAWWHRSQTVSCSVLETLGSESTMAAVGMMGMVIAIIGVTLGGARHTLTAWGVVILVFGLLGAAVLGEMVGRICTAA